MTTPTRNQLDDACCSYRHDYGILDEDARESLRLNAAKWFFIWQKELEHTASDNEAIRKQFCKLLGFADFYSWEAIYDQVKLMKLQA